MLFVLDVGNSNIVAGVYAGDALVEHWRIQTHGNRTVDEYDIVLRQLFSISSLHPEDVSAAIISSVVPPLTPLFEEICERCFGVSALVVGPGVRTGMPIRIDNPKEVGADRIVNAVAAYERYGEAVIAVDFGTATNFDAVDDSGAYQGGALAPGVGISVDALFSRAAKLPKVQVARPTQVIGRSTVAALQSGTYFGYVGLVDEIVRRMRTELSPGSVPCIATGGLAHLFAESSSTITDVDPYLTLDGLRIVFLRNQ